MKRWLKLALLLLVFVLLFYVLRGYDIPALFTKLQDFVQAQGALGALIFVGVYILTTVLAVPGSALTIMAGAIFGSVLGVGLVIVGATLGASLCFLISRYFARDIVSNILNKSEKFQKLDNLTEKNGYIIVAITRLVPLFPFNLLNYGFGLTKVPFKVYFLWSALCMLPGTILYVVGADAVSTAIRNGEIPWILVFIVLLILAILFVIVKKAKKSLKE